jgi:hypothetical protein
MSDLAGPADVIANVDSEDSYVRIQGPTNAGALEPRQAAGFSRSADHHHFAADAAGDPRLPAGHGCCSPRSWAGAGSRRASEYERHAGGCRPDAGWGCPLPAIRGSKPLKDQ